MLLIEGIAGIFVFAWNALGSSSGAGTTPLPIFNDCSQLCFINRSLLLECLEARPCHLGISGSERNGCSAVMVAAFTVRIILLLHPGNKKRGHYPITDSDRVGFPGVL